MAKSLRVPVKKEVWLWAIRESQKIRKRSLSGILALTNGLMVNNILRLDS